MQVSRFFPLAAPDAGILPRPEEGEARPTLWIVRTVRCLERRCRRAV
jgi:hypothetical protein